ncbi:MAG: YraN family protein [Myxococcota bacterium]
MSDSSPGDAPWRALRGQRAEDLAARHLRRRGCVILGRNVRVGHLELDIVARDVDAVVVVEVRARGKGAWTRPLATIDRAKRDKLRRAATLLWRRRWSRWRWAQRVRFDVVSVHLDTGGAPALHHVRAAFV